MPGPSIDDWQLDDQLPEEAAGLLKLDSFAPQFSNGQRMVLEGGSIDVNGRGTLITTEECLLSDVQQRNAGHTRADLERAFHDYLGIDQVLVDGSRHRRRRYPRTRG